MNFTMHFKVSCNDVIYNALQNRQHVLKMLFKMHVGRTSCKEHETSYCRPTALLISPVGNDCCKQIGLIIIIISLDEAKHKCQGRRRLQASR